MAQERREFLSRTLRREICERDMLCCRYCGSFSLNGEVDHVVSWQAGGAHDASNLVYSCGPCNKRKGTKTEGWTPVEFDAHFEHIVSCVQAQIHVLSEVKQMILDTQLELMREGLKKKRISPRTMASWVEAADLSVTPQHSTQES